MGYNGSNRRPKFDVGSKRDAKRMSKLVASFITAPLAVDTSSSRRRRKSSSSDTLTPKDEAFGVFGFTLIATPIIIHFTKDLFRSGDIIAGIVIFALLILMWFIVYLAYKSANKDK